MPGNTGGWLEALTLNSLPEGFPGGFSATQKEAK
jgi:hypothetical protein